MEILIVDDEPQVAEVLAKSLAREGHSAKIANSGEEALRLLVRAVGAREDADERERLLERARSRRSDGRLRPRHPLLKNPVGPEAPPSRSTVTVSSYARDRTISRRSVRAAAATHVERSSAIGSTNPSL